MINRPHRIFRFPVASLLLLGLLSLTGCNVFYPALYLLTPPATTPAKYVPAKEPMLILVENQQNPDMALFEADQLAGYLQNQLAENKVAPIVSPSVLANLRDTKHDEMGKMSIATIGRETSAQQVLYVNLVQSGITNQAGTPMQGHLKLFVRLVDVKTASTLWPRNDPDGYPLTFETPNVEGANPADQSAVREQLLRGVADQIAKLFYEWKTEG